MDSRHPLKLVVNRRGVWWPLPFAVLMFITFSTQAAWSLIWSAMDRNLLVLPWTLVWVWAAASSLREIRGHVRWLTDRRRQRLRSAAAGLCPRCGYCLTGNVSGVCPECGAPAAAAEGAA